MGAVASVIAHLQKGNYVFYELVCIRAFLWFFKDLKCMAGNIISFHQLCALTPMLMAVHYQHKCFDFILLRACNLSEFYFFRILDKLDFISG